MNDEPSDQDERVLVTQRGPTNPPFALEGPEVRAQLIIDCASGESYRSLGQRYGVNPASVWGFAQRHRADIDEARSRVYAAVSDTYLADKVARIRELAGLYEHMDDTLRSTDDGAIGKSALAREARGALADIARELDELPRGNVNVNVDNRSVTIVRDYGPDGRRALDDA